MPQGYINFIDSFEENYTMFKVLIFDVLVMFACVLFWLYD